MTDAENWCKYAAEQLGMPLALVPIVILSAAVVYLAFTAIIKLFGVRALTATTTSDFVFVIMLGAVAGRGVMGLHPTVATALVALLTLFSLEMFSHRLRDTWVARRLTHTEPIVVFAHGEPVEEMCERTHTSEEDLATVMRSAGVAQFSEVQAIILEPTGGYSLIRAEEEINLGLFKNLKGVEYLNPDNNL